MCGIAGVFEFERHCKHDFSALSEKFRKKMKFRGPDSEGEFISNHVLLAHTRLSVIDTSQRASQPMHSADGKCTIVFNGEIFNFKTLREQLQKKGYEFHSASDTEVVLNLYLEYGTNFLEQLNGFFALAIYDARQNKMIVARDRFGIKPLLFYADQYIFVFASEMKALLANLQPQELDHASLRMFFRLTYIPPPYTIFKNIHKLVPGCFLIVSESGIEKKCYYSIKITSSSELQPHDYSTSCQTLATLLDDAVQMQMVADVPLGCFLSGGIDSSIITALASRHTSNLNTFSIGFKNNPYYDETRYAEIVATHFNTNHHFFMLSNDDLLEAVEQMLSYLDEPFADSSALPVFILSRETRKHVTVVLSGDGADEMFGGYNKHVAENRIRNKHLFDKLLLPVGLLINQLPASRSKKTNDTFRKLQKYIAAARLSPTERYLFLLSFNSFGLIERLLISYRLHDDFQTRWHSLASEIDDLTHGIEDVLLSDMKIVLSGDMLHKVDMMSMAHSLEVRPPFLDHRIVNFAFSIPTSYKIKDKQNKRILRDAFQTILPTAILQRGKHGFEVPMNEWFRTDMKPMIDRYLLSYSYIENQKLFRPDVIKNIIDYSEQHKHHDLQPLIWSLLVFQYWYEQNEYNIKKDWL